MVLFCASLFFGSGLGGELVASQAFSELIGLAEYFNAFDLCHDCCHRVFRALRCHSRSPRNARFSATCTSPRGSSTFRFTIYDLDELSPISR